MTVLDNIADALPTITALGTIFAIVFGCFSVSRNKREDNECEGKQDGVMESDIRYIKTGIDDIKAEQKEQRKTNIEVLTRLSMVESSTKQAHHRIDRLEQNEHN